MSLSYAAIESADNEEQFPVGTLKVISFCKTKTTVALENLDHTQALNILNESHCQCC